MQDIPSTMPSPCHKKVSKLHAIKKKNNNQKFWLPALDERHET